jgi:hypothetical protein
VRFGSKYHTYRYPTEVLNITNMFRLSTFGLLSGLLVQLDNIILAQQVTATTVTVINYNWDPTLYASVIAANPTATTYKLGCPADDPATCRYGHGVPSITIVAGPSTAAETLSVESLKLTVSVTCKLTGPGAGPCVYSERSAALFGESTFDATKRPFATLTVTGGLEKLAQATLDASVKPQESQKNDAMKATLPLRGLATILAVMALLASS